MKVAVIMGSSSGWKIMQGSCAVLEQFEMSYKKKVVSAHHTPKLMLNFTSEVRTSDYDVIIIGVGSAVHLPEMVASTTILPVIGAPIESESLKGLDSLLSIIQIPDGIPAATTAIGKSGTKNVGVLTVRTLDIGNDSVHKHLEQYEQSLTDRVGEMQNKLQ